VTDAPVELSLEVTDDRTHLLLRDGKGLVRAGIDTDDERVREWALAEHRRRWGDAEPLGPEDL
jgi:hypothetical protein